MGPPLAAIAATITLGLTAIGCSGGDSDSSVDAPSSEEAGDGVPAGAELAPGTEAATAATVSAQAAADDVGGRQDATGEVGAGADQTEGADVAKVADVVQAAGTAGTVAIDARAAIAVDDVRDAVEAITTIVTGRGGRVTSADVDYLDASGTSPGDGALDTSQAVLVLDVPPEELTAVIDAVEELGTMSSFDQLAEDVAPQLTDLDVRIANERASIERVRGLIDSAASLQDLVFLESELTSRETNLETLLASQRQLVDRVAMSTLTLAVTTLAPQDLVVRGEFETPRPGIVEAFSDGWNALAGAAFTIVLVLAVASPFLAVALVLLALVRPLRRLLARSRPTPAPPTPTPTPPSGHRPDESTAVPAGGTASRRE